MNCQRFMWFCSVFYLISQYGILCAINKRRTRYTQKQVTEDPQLLEHYVKHMQSRVAHLELRVKRLERDDSRRNILMYNVDFLSSDPKKLEEKVIKFIRQNVDVDVPPDEVDFIKIINKGNSSEPIVQLGLTTWTKKYDILKKSYKLRSHVKITDDFPPEVIEKRKELLAEMRRLRNMGRFATVKYDHLFTKNDMK